MKIYLDYIPCFMQQAFRTGQIATSVEKKIKLILNKIGKIYFNANYTCSNWNNCLSYCKGQGNYKVLSDCNRQILFLLKAKCPVIARVLNVKVDDII